MDEHADANLARRLGWLVFVLALVVRLVYVFEADASPLFEHPAVDAKTYAHHAQRLAAGNSLGVGEGQFWQPPLYPYILGAIKVLFPESFFYVVRFVQALLGALVCAMSWWIGRALFNPVVGLLAGVGTALCGPLIFFDGELLPASLAAFVDLLALVVLLHVWRRPSRWGFLGAGAAFGIGALVVPTVLVFAVAVPVVLLWVAPRRQSLIWAGAFALGLILAVAPVAWRNWVIGGDGVGISYNAGINLYIGNNPDYAETVAIRPGWEWDDLVTQPAREGIERPSAKSAYFAARAWDYIRGDPIAWLGLMGYKLGAFWHGDEHGRNQPIYFWRTYSQVMSATLWKTGIAFPFGLVAPLALWGMLLSLRRIGPTWPLLYVLCYCLGVVAFFVAARYRVPVLPVLVVFASYGVWSLWDWGRARCWRNLGLGLAVCLVFAFAANSRLAPMDMEGDAAIHYNLGNAYAEAGDKELALAAFERAVAEDPEYWQAWLNLGGVKAALGDLAGGEAIFAQVAQKAPRQVEPWMNLAHVRIMQRDIEGAFSYYESALKANPKLLPAYVEMIRLYGQMGDLARAAHVLQRAVDHLPAERERLRQFYEEMQARALGR